MKDVESKNCKILQENQIRNLVGLYIHRCFLDSQLNEVKRKIALVEGKRRALQSSFERENKKNRAALTRLGEEVQVLVIAMVWKPHQKTSLRTPTKSWRWQEALLGIY